MRGFCSSNQLLGIDMRLGIRCEIRINRREDAEDPGGVEKTTLPSSTDGETRELSSVNLMEVPHYTCSKALLRESLSWMWNVREKEGAAVQSIQSQRATEQAQNVLAAGLIP